MERNKDKQPPAPTPPHPPACTRSKAGGGSHGGARREIPRPFRKGVGRGDCKATAHGQEEHRGGWGDEGQWGRREQEEEALDRTVEGGLGSELLLSLPPLCLRSRLCFFSSFFSSEACVHIKHMVMSHTLHVCIHMIRIVYVYSLLMLLLLFLYFC